MKPGKFFLVGGLLLVALLAGWEVLRTWERPPVPVPVPAPVIPPLPPPAPLIPKQPLPVVKKAKPLPPPVQAARKPPVAKKVPPPAVIPKPAPPAAPQPVVQPPVVIPSAPVAAPQEWQGTDTAVTHAGQVVIRNDRQWVHFWSEHRPHEAAPEIDFANYMILGVFAGPRPAEPFMISIVSVRTQSNSLIVDYRERLPPTGTFAVNVTVYPYHIKAVPRSTLPVKFNLLQPENAVR